MINKLTSNAPRSDIEKKINEIIETLNIILPIVIVSDHGQETSLTQSIDAVPRPDVCDHLTCLSCYNSNCQFKGKQIRCCKCGKVKNE